MIKEDTKNAINIYMASPFDYSGLQTNVTSTVTSAHDIQTGITNVTNRSIRDNIKQSVNRITPTQITDPTNPVNTILASVPNSELSTALKNITGINVGSQNVDGIKAKIQTQLSILKVNLIQNIKTCIKNALRGLVYRVFPNLSIPDFGKVRQILDVEARLNRELDKIRRAGEQAIDKFLEKTRLNRLSDFWLQQYQNRLNNEINKHCQKLSPKQKKDFGIYEAKMDSFVNQQVDSFANDFESKIVKDKQGQLVTNSTDFTQSQSSTSNSNNPLTIFKNGTSSLVAELKLIDQSTLNVQKLLTN